MSLRDAQGRRRRGTVTLTDDARDAIASTRKSDEFTIILLSAPGPVGYVPPRVAVCIPAQSRVRAIVAFTADQIPDDVNDLTFPPHRMEAYAEGRVMAAAPDLIEPVDVFPPHSDHPRLDRLALALIDVAEAEIVAPYVAAIRLELSLPPGSEALVELEGRLAPAEPAERPPPRAPAIGRLSLAAKRLRRQQPPTSTLEQFSDDLRFLRTFERDPGAWTPEALDRLLANVLEMKPERRARAPKHQRDAGGPSRIVPFPGADAPAEGGPEGVE
jgi:hypothetical protein